MRFEPIGIIRSVYKEKFGIPRQAGLVRSARATLKLKPEMKLALRGLDDFSHLWVIFVFSESKGWNPLVRPPRLGGARKVGTLASRSPHRPNPIGLSVVEIERIIPDARGGPEISVRGGDFLDGTPILDLKPYIAYADSIRRTRDGWADEILTRKKVAFSPAASRTLGADGRKLVREVIALDPRPAFQAGKDGEYSMRIDRFDVHWRTQWKAQGERLLVTSVDLA